MSGPVPPQTPDGVIAVAVAAAQAADQDWIRSGAGSGTRWTAVPDDQARRLIEAAAGVIRKAERERIAAELDQRADGRLDRHFGEWSDIGARYGVTTIAVTLRNTASAIRADGHAVNLRAPFDSAGPAGGDQ